MKSTKSPENINKSLIVRSHDVQLDSDYVQWIADLKQRYRSAQAKVAVRVNGEKLLFNWELGRDLVQKKAEERWGAGVVEQVSLDLKQEFPDADGFSATNLWYMKQWYLFYSGSIKKLHQLGGEIPSKKLHQAGGEFLRRNILDNQVKQHQVGAEFPIAFALVPWRHHVEIISKCKTIDEALFYIRETKRLMGKNAK